MVVCIIVPARLKSSRLPGKVVLAETGMPLVQHVVESVKGCKGIDRIVVATDGEEVVKALEPYGTTCVMTSADHPTGTDRLAEAATKIGLKDDDLVINVQGDEPDMDESIVESLAELMTKHPDAAAGTAVTPLDPDQASNPNRVKAVLATDGKVLYFSRCPIPFPRDGQRGEYNLHLGLYAYRVAFLKQYVTMAPTPLESTEKLEQLRVLENGYTMYAIKVNFEGHGVDTQEDYDKFVARFKATHP